MTGILQPKTASKILTLADRLQSRIATQPSVVSLLPHQQPPEGDWPGWLMLAGRGSGKTAGAAHYVTQHVNGPPCLPGPVPHNIAVIAPTLGDAATAVNGPAGLRAFTPTLHLSIKPGGLIAVYPNGAEIKLFGAHTEADVDRLRAGGNRCLVWFDELAAARYIDDAWSNMLLGLRSGPDPRWIATTTPRTKKLIKELEQDAKNGLIKITRATTDDNPYLPERIRKMLYKKYEGTSVGLQELQGKVVEQVEGALWERLWIESNRLAPDDLEGGTETLKSMMSHIVVGVDPSGGSGEQGIIVVGKGHDERGYVLGDYTCRLSPGGWAERTIQAFEEWEADQVVVERNYGGDMVRDNIATMAATLDIDVPIKEVIATRGKHVRAQPVSQLTQNGRWVFAGHFPELEDQLCTWTYDEKDSPDRMDAMVWPAYALRLVSNVSARHGRMRGSAHQRANQFQ
jgi:phage terminase large subunit-like protein